MQTVIDSNECLRAARAFLETIEITGGIFVTHEGYHAPVGDPDWTDLGNVYLQFCKALGQTPLLDTRDEDDIRWDT